MTFHKSIMGTPVQKIMHIEKRLFSSSCYKLPMMASLQLLIPVYLIGRLQGLHKLPEVNEGSLIHPRHVYPEVLPVCWVGHDFLKLQDLGTWKGQC